MKKIKVLTQTKYPGATYEAGKTYTLHKTIDRDTALHLVDIKRAVEVKETAKQEVMEES